MRKTLLALTFIATAGVGGIAGSLIRDAAAQSAPPPAPTAETTPRPPSPDGFRAPMPEGFRPHPWMEGWMHRMHPGPMGGPMGRPMGGPMHGRGTFALLFRPEDRALSAPDVQKIAEGFLLWNGNHTWKVIDVAENQDNTVSFAIATQSGDVIARFTMDRRTGHLRRVG